jgi:hypothetical protein
MQSRIFCGLPVDCIVVPVFRGPGCVRCVFGVCTGFVEAPMMNPARARVHPRADTLPGTNQEQGNMQAAGSFEVKIIPQSEDKAEGSTLGRMLLDKKYHGPLDAMGKGEMLTVGTATQGSAVYVAVERVSGMLDGKSGSFALHHRGIMRRGEPELAISVVPDSGTGELTGLSGTLTIRIEAGGQHFYEFSYELAG